MQAGRDSAGEGRDGIVGPLGRPPEAEFVGLLEDVAELQIQNGSVLDLAID